MWFRRRRGPNVCTQKYLVGCCTLLSADIVDTLVSVIVEVVVEAVRRERFQSQHPLVFPFFKEPSVLQRGFVYLQLFDKGKTSVVVKVMSWQQEMFIESAAFWTMDVMTMCIYSKIRRRLAFADVLPCRA